MNQTNSPTHGILRGVTAATGGAALAASSDDFIQILGALTTMATIVWSVYEKRTAYRAAAAAPPPAGPPLVLCVLAAGLLLTGCTLTRVHSGEGATRASVSSYTVAWPWLDTAKSVDRASLAAATNKSTLSLSGYSESETTSTNAAALLERSISAAVGAAVKAAAK